MTINIRKLIEEDEKEVCSLLTNEEVKETFMVADYSSYDGVLKLFKYLLNSSIDDSSYIRGIIYNDIIVGFLLQVEKNDDYIELGYVVDPIYKGKGIATSSLILSIEELFKNGVNKVRCGYFEENTPSKRVMEKANMQPIDLITEELYHNKKHICRYYEIINTK